MVVWSEGGAHRAGLIPLGLVGLQGRPLRAARWLSCWPRLIWLVGITKCVIGVDGLEWPGAGVGGIAAIGCCRELQPAASAGGARAGMLRAAALAGACFGFLRHNVQTPARIFMAMAAPFLGVCPGGYQHRGPPNDYRKTQQQRKHNGNTG